MKPADVHPTQNLEVIGVGMSRAWVLGVCNVPDLEYLRNKGQLFGISYSCREL